ncbi:hypothetical protein KY290_010722 [Solanum tuberosum]|uniref:Uncharacterized protein n=1 Tax=Solanum tuberosum TaxID=4113 RepID=A0ABQ7VZ42_SOLTU|nr:hypothetical protein KY290_010722 [Solanum tuberosum]
MEDQKVLEVFVGDSIQNSIQEMKDCISKDLAEFRSMLLEEVPSVTEYPNRLEVVLSNFCQPDILSPCLAHVTDSPLPQNYDEQSEYPIKIDEHKVFDEMLNSNCPKVFTVALDAPFEILDEDVIGPDGSKVQLFYGHPQIDMSERHVSC